MKTGTLDTIDLCGRKVDYLLVQSKFARKLRVRVGVKGVEVLRPDKRKPEDVTSFLHANGEWIISQLERVERFRLVRKPKLNNECEILYRGEPTAVVVEDIARRQGTNKVIFEPGRILIMRGRASQTPPSKSLENWLRKQARLQIEQQLEVVTHKLNRFPHKVYVMGQRTKWGNCSSLQNLSFNWRLIMAPDFVLRYLVTHEAVHLAVPDHSKRFWLSVRSLCRDTEKAKQWLSAHGHRLLFDFDLSGIE